MTRPRCSVDGCDGIGTSQFLWDDKPPSFMCQEHADEYLRNNPPKPEVWRTEYTEEEELREYERDLMLRDD